MRFAAPDGTDLISPLGGGSVFQVALVSEGGLTLVCKRLTPRSLLEAAGRAAIVREAKVLALAHHPALPSLVRVGSDVHGPFLLETRADGVSLRELVEGWRYRGRPVAPRLIGHVAEAATEALAEIQVLTGPDGPLGIVHGDLGPEHVLLGPLGQVRLVDFGAARWNGMPSSLVTEDRGTLPWVAPEIARGDAPPSAGGDVYSLAATLLYLATGQPPCDARDEAAMLGEIGERGVQAEARLAGAAAFDGPQRSALAAALRHDPHERDASIGALCAAFAAASSAAPG